MENKKLGIKDGLNGSLQMAVFEARNFYRKTKGAIRRFGDSGLGHKTSRRNPTSPLIF